MIDDEPIEHKSPFQGARRKRNRILRSGGMCRLGNEPLLDDQTQCTRTIFEVIVWCLIVLGLGYVFC